MQRSQRCSVTSHIGQSVGEEVVLHRGGLSVWENQVGLTNTQIKENHRLCSSPTNENSCRELLTELVKQLTSAQVLVLQLQSEQIRSFPVKNINALVLARHIMRAECLRIVRRAAGREGTQPTA